MLVLSGQAAKVILLIIGITFVAGESLPVPSFYQVLKQKFSAYKHFCNASCRESILNQGEKN